VATSPPCSGIPFIVFDGGKQDVTVSHSKSPFISESRTHLEHQIASAL
jgi:hypothetical protein